MSRIQGVPARICTWEVVTGFGQNPTDDDLMEYFHRDFPEMERLPKFWKLISFNSSEGRHHRYLAILGEVPDLHGVGLKRGRRVLPTSLFLFALADRRMGSWEQYENFRYAALADGTLYILVFYEGRLCHWSEERGYGGSNGRKLATERLLRMDEYLHQDPLFSESGAFRCGDLEQLEGDFDEFDKERKALFQKAAIDPFWKGLHLEPVRHERLVSLSIILLLLMMFAVYLGWKHFEAESVALAGPMAPMLTPPKPGPISNEPRFVDALEPIHPKIANTALTCTKPSLKISGIVGEKLLFGMLDGERFVKRPGDSLGHYRVKQVLRDRVVLSCGGREWEVANGPVP